MSKSPWGNIGAWAAEAERAEEEEREAAASAQAATGDSQKFPSLKESVTAAGKQKKKTKMTLQEFAMAGSYGGSSAASSRLTPEEMLRLPTGPKERSAEEMQHGRLGGGFSNYGSRSGGGPPGRSRDRDYDSEAQGGRRGYGGFEDDRRRGPQTSRVSEFEQMPSRADEVDNWASVKRSQPAFDSHTASGPARPSRYAALGGGSGGSSMADEVDSWASVKKPLPSAQLRSSSFGSGFRSEARPGPEPERWTRDFNNNNINNNQQRERLVLEQPVGKVNKGNPFGEARPREEVLSEKGLDWKKVDMEIEVKKMATSRPTSSQSSRPGSSQSGRSEGLALQGTVEAPAVKPKPRVNPFGDAKPREVLLQEKGLDWKKIDLDLEHRRIDRPETEEEQNLKQEIEHLKKESLQISGEEQANLREVILQKEKDLESLIRELDDKVRFGQKAIDRPGSGSGRYTGPPVRPPSQPGQYEEPKAAEFMDRPRSRGTGEVWSRPSDDRRSFSGGRDRGFLGSRDLDRSSSRERW